MRSKRSCVTLSKCVNVVALFHERLHVIHHAFRARNRLSERCKQNIKKLYPKVVPFTVCQIILCGSKFVYECIECAFITPVLLVSRRSVQCA